MVDPNDPKQRIPETETDLRGTKPQRLPWISPRLETFSIEEAKAGGGPYNFSDFDTSLS